MNSLSLFILIADIIPKLFFVGLVLVFAGFVLAFMLPKVGVEFGSSGHNPFDGLTRKSPYVLGIMGLCFMVLSPSKETLHLIAVSQIGEQIVQLEEVQALGGETADLARVSIEALRNMISQTLPEPVKEE